MNNSTLETNRNEAILVERSFTTRLCVRIIGFLSNGLLAWLLYCTYSNNTFTDYYIRINAAVFQMLFDVLQISISLLILNRNLLGYEKLSRLCSNFEQAFILHTMSS